MHFLQTKRWAEFKAHHGWRFLELTFEELSFVMMYRMAPGLGGIGYVPKLAVSAEKLPLLVELLRGEGKKLGLVFVRLEALLDAKVKISVMENVSQTWSDPNPRACIILSLPATHAEWLASLKQKTRYNVNLAERKGVVVERVECNAENMQKFFALIKATTERGEFAGRPYSYYAEVWSMYAKSGDGQLIFTSLEGELLGGAFVLKEGTEAFFRDGGSVRGKASNTMFSYLLQSECVKWAIEQDCTSYDLIAVPPRSELENPNHHFAKLYQFKSMFSPEVTEYLPAFDIQVDASKYALVRKFWPLWQRVYGTLSGQSFW